MATIRHQSYIFTSSLGSEIWPSFLCSSGHRWGLPLLFSNGIIPSGPNDLLLHTDSNPELLVVVSMGFDFSYSNIFIHSI